MNSVIITAIASILILLALEVALLEAYRAGERKAEQKFADERTRLQELMEEHRIKLEDIRIRENQAKKIIRQWEEGRND